MKAFFSLFLFGFLTASAQRLNLKPHLIRLKSGLQFKLNVPKGYQISVAFEGLKRPRFFSKSPDGRLFLTDLFDVSDNNSGRVLVLDGWNEREKRFTRFQTYLDHLRNPNQVAFYTANGKTLLYVAETDKLSCYAFRAGDTLPSSAPAVIATFPAYGLNYKYGGWHLTRSLAFNRGKLYVSVGSSCNACVEKEAVRATVLQMNPDGSEQKIYASGLRNSVGIKWIDNTLWATGMGRDLIGPDKPDDLFLAISENVYYGWPFYYQSKGTVFADKQFTDSVRNRFVKKPPVAPWGFKAHAAPLGFDYFKNFSDTALSNRFLVALHGSTSVWRQSGNAVVQLLPNGRYRTVVSGFLAGNTEDKRYGRPCDVMQRDAASFFVSDDKSGVVYFIWKEK